MALEDSQENNTSLRIVKGQKSFNGLKVISGQIYEDCNADLRWPQCMTTYKAMCKDATIAPALNYMEMEISKVEWKVKIPEGYDDELKEKAEFLTSVMNDMEHTWNDFIRRAATFNRYGFAPIEKVYRKRTSTTGSKYNDGRYGLASLPLISQDSVDSWRYSKDGRQLIGLEQTVNIPTSKNSSVHTYQSGTEFIPRNKFVLFRADPQKDSPIGTSPLNGVYVAWRFKTELEKFESTGISQDLRGLKVFKVPAQIMSESASEDQKATYEAFKEMLRGLHNGEQSGVIIPSAMDANGNDLFDFQLMSVMGQAQFDINEIIARYRNEIITGILCPQLVLGQNGSGSFALAENLQRLTETVVGARLREIRDQLNHDLIPQLFKLNGWDVSVTPYFDFDEVQESSLDDLSKYIQRIASIGGIVMDAEMVNWVHMKIGAPIPFDDTDLPIEEVRQQVSNFTSNSGEGMEAGTVGNGTSSSASSRDNSVANMEN